MLMRALAFMSLSASAARPSLLWRTWTCSFKDPASKARSKGLLAGINYTLGMLHLPNYLQLLHPWASPWPGERGSSHCTTTSSSYMGARTGKQRSNCKCHLSGRHFSQIWAVMVSMALLFASHLGSWQTPTQVEDRKKKEKKKKSKHCCQQRPIYGQCSGLAFNTAAGHFKKAIPLRASRLWGRRTRQGEGAQVTEPVQPLPRLWTSAGKSSAIASARKASLLQTTSCFFRAKNSLPRKGDETKKKQNKPQT